MKMIMSMYIYGYFMKSRVEHAMTLQEYNTSFQSRVYTSYIYRKWNFTINVSYISSEQAALCGLSRCSPLLSRPGRAIQLMPE